MPLFDRETDPAKEKEGVPLDFGDFRVTLRRAGGANDTYELELDKALKPFRALIKHGKMDQKTMNELVYRVFARTCIVRWETRHKSMRNPPSTLTPDDQGWVRGIDLRGTLVADDVETIVAVFQALPSVFLDIQSASRGEDLFRLEQREDATGN